MTRLASHFRNKADEARVARVWSRVDTRLSRQERHRPWRTLTFGSIGCLALALAAYLAGGRGSSGRVTSAPTAQVLHLVDGSRVEHAAQDPLEVVGVTPERIELRMQRGRALFRVAENKHRAFLTHAGAYTIRVVGTEYAVDLARDGVRVDVTKGEVEVRRDDSRAVWRVRAGQSWSSASYVQAETVQPGLTPPAAPAPVPAPVTTAPPVSAPSAALRGTGARRVGSARASAAADVEAAAALFQHAQEARAHGLREDTARMLAEFLHRFPGDARAGLAAFELGRLRLEMGDPKGAREALDRAENAGVAFREQVQARRVQALEESGDLSACRGARAAFLAQFPRGTFAEIVRRRCP
ncbi:MAG TPA: FecR domain-containing protein [Polyangiales bacterium]